MIFERTDSLYLTKPLTAKQLTKITDAVNDTILNENVLEKYFPHKRKLSYLKVLSVGLRDRLYFLTLHGMAPREY